MLVDPKAIEAVLPACSSDSSSDSRLMAVRLENSRAIATDGYRIHVATWKAPASEDYPKIEGCNPVGPDLEPCSIPKDAAAKLAKMAPKHSKHCPILAYLAVDTAASNQNGILKVGSTDLESPQVVNVQKMESSFPRYEGVVPKLEDAVAEAVFNGSYLADACKAASKLCKAGNMPQSVKIRFYGKGKPIRIDCKGIDGQEFTAVIMPMKE